MDIEVVRTFGLETGIGVIGSLGLSLSNLEFWFLEMLVIVRHLLFMFCRLTWKSFFFSFFLFALEPISILTHYRDTVSRNYGK